MSESNPELNLNQQPPKKEIIKTWHAVTGGATLAATPEAIKLVRQHEKLSTPIDQRNIFEVGRHTINDKERKQIEARFEKGDPDAHRWSYNPELETRLVAFAPQVLTIDSLPITGKNLNKKWAWLISPARPRKINPLGFYAVAGDVPSYLYKGIARSLGAYMEKPEDSFLNTTLEIINENELNNPVYDEYLKKQKRLSVAALLVSAISNVSYIYSKWSQGTEPSIGRRGFLKGMAAFAALTGTAGLLNAEKTFIKEYGPRKFTYSITEQQKEFWQSLTSYTDEMPPDVWLDGRTAMLIAKHEDSMHFLRQNKYLTETAKGAIVAGYTHAYKADLYMHDKIARETAIHAYTKQAIEITNRFIYDHYKIPAYQRAELTGSILDYFSTVEINHVSDPGIPPGVKLTDYIETNIQPVATFKSPQVENAIKSLRPK